MGHGSQWKDQIQRNRYNNQGKNARRYLVVLIPQVYHIIVKKQKRWISIWNFKSKSFQINSTIPKRLKTYINLRLLNCQRF